MITINQNFLALQKSYLFTEIAHRVAAFKEVHPDARIIRLGIGDVTRPLAPAVIEALHKAVEEQAQSETFRGYGPEQGYGFLRDSIVEHDFAARGLDIAADEVFISDGAKSDIGNFTDILGAHNRVCLTDPVYPVYIDTNVMAGRAGTFDAERWSQILYCPCTDANDFVPALPAERPDVIYLCYPNNPTGTTLTHQQLKVWVDYALQHDALILFDAAYEAYISRPDVPHSIYEVEGARRCAVEFHSFSKTAGFTGLRCGYTVVPRDVTAMTANGERVALNPLWNRRQCTKFNGTPYIVQRAAAATYTEEGRKQVRETISYYMENARLMREALTAAGLKVYGGIDAPYLWVKTPDGMTSWQYFTFLLERYHIVSTPGVGFGPSGEGFIRLTAFGTRADCEEAVLRLKA